MSERRLTKTAQEYLTKSDEERIECCGKDFWIHYHASTKLIELLEYKFNEPKQMRRKGLLIYGDYANGKTAILKKFYDLHKTSLETFNDKGEHVFEIPIIYFQAPTIPDEGRLYSLILDELCVPHKPTEKVMEKARLVVHYLEKLNTKMMLIDEIHSSLRGNLNKQRSFIDTLKQLSNKLSLSIVLAGTKEAHSALSIGGETASRFPSLELPRWSNDKKFRSFLGTYESCLPLKEASNLALDQQLVDILYNQSEGLIGRTVNLLKKAAVNAIKSKREKIIIDDIVYLPTL